MEVKYEEPTEVKEEKEDGSTEDFKSQSTN
jgi:hypothetical protein